MMRCILLRGGMHRKVAWTRTVLAPWPRTLRLLLLLALAGGAFANPPLFDVSTRMRILLVPSDARVGDAIYRLKASDSDYEYPLHFDVLRSPDSNVIRIEALPCPRNATHCEANVVLAAPLRHGRDQEVKVTVRDTSGDSTTVNCTLRATNATTPMDTIFPHHPQLITVSEYANRGTPLDYIVVRNHPLNNRHAFLELYGSPLFDLKRALSSPDTVNNTIVLVGQLDFERQVVHYLTVYATDAYAEPGNDTRNLLSFQLAIVVRDEQDQPPIFTHAPPITRINSSLRQGDVVLRVEAQDGDRGVPRAITYGLVSESQPLAPFFHVDEHTGEVSLARSMEELLAVTHVGVPLLLTLVAEEARPPPNEAPAAQAEVTVALIMESRANHPPYFASSDYDVHIDENSLIGTALNFPPPYETVIRDEDVGKHGLFSIELTDNNGTFEVSPAVGEGHTSFIITVRDPSLLDYEQRQMITFKVVARELSPFANRVGGAGGAPAGREDEAVLSSAATVSVHIDDINDNAPQFMKERYEARVREDAPAGTVLVQVNATDADTGRFGRVRYTHVFGEGNDTLLLDHMTGVVSIRTNSHCFDREVAKEFNFYVEARDLDGEGLRTFVPLVVTVIDVNDHTPRFERTTYDFYLTSDRSRFLVPAIVKAYDDDAEYPNNVVRYIISNPGPFVNVFNIDKESGELTVKNTAALNRTVKNNADFDVQIMISAYDMGDPSQKTFCLVRVHPAASPPRTMRFIMAGSQRDVEQTQRLLSQVTGARVVVLNMQPYKGDGGEGDGGASAGLVRVGRPPVKHLAPTATGSGGSSPVIARDLGDRRAGRGLAEELPEDSGQGLAAVEAAAGASGGSSAVAASGNQPPGSSVAASGSGDQRSLEKTMVEADVLIEDQNRPFDLSLLQTTGTAGTNGTVIVKEVQKSETYTRSDSLVVFWILIVLAIIIVIAIIVLVLCCLCAGCPLYVSPS